MMLYERDRSSAAALGSRSAAVHRCGRCRIEAGDSDRTRLGRERALSHEAPSDEPSLASRSPLNKLGARTARREPRLRPAWEWTHPTAAGRARGQGPERSETLLAEKLPDGKLPQGCRARAPGAEIPPECWAQVRQPSDHGGFWTTSEADGDRRGGFLGHPASNLFCNFQVAESSLP